MTEEIKGKVRQMLGVYEIDAEEFARLDLHIDGAFDFFVNIKGIAETVITSISGLQLITIYVNDVWREQGEFKFSPATEILFNSLMDATAGLNYADSFVSGYN